MIYNGYKLVRDKIPEIIRASQGSDECERVLDIIEYKRLLVKKLEEEVNELREALASEKQSLIEDELADVYEVLVALGDTHRCRDIIEVAQEKFSKRGGFYQGHILKVDST
jgi:predicted house-cleaning noncanonical NTP pyrophosphatase (MazG superfamily)